MKYLKLFQTLEEYYAYMAGRAYFPNVSFVREPRLTFYNNPAISTIVLDQNLTDPAVMISGGVNGEAIQLIRQNSHRYLGKNTSTGVMTICQLDDSDSTKYANGVSADLTGASGDVFMRLPKFSYKAVETEANKWEVSFCYNAQPDSSWKLWDGNDLIGVYEAYKTDQKIYSRSGVSSSPMDKAAANVYAQNRGEGFSPVKLKHHNIIAFLFYAMYGTTNSQEAIGAGNSSTSKTCGRSDSLGMADSTSDHIMTNFWGLENWWGNKCEFIGNVSHKNSVLTITEDDGTTRTVIVPSQSAYISKIHVGEHLDALPSEVNGSSTTCFCDQYSFTSSANTQLVRSGKGNGVWSGVSYLGLPSITINNESEYTSRLVFRGTIVEEQNTDNFNSLETIS